MKKFWNDLRYWLKSCIIAVAVVALAMAVPLIFSGSESEKSEKACNELKDVLEFEEVKYIRKSCYGLDKGLVTPLF